MKSYFQSIGDDITNSRRRIQKVAEERLKEKLNVICVKGDLSYYAYTELFCQTSKEDITCYAFKPF
uniref:Ground-like domain-containing protein n=1 Tax=Parascaris equorum TaxID=6256 RepID=A0A914R2V6_PAREQ